MKLILLSIFFAGLAASTECDPPTCFGDLTCDGVIATGDLLVLLDAWDLTTDGDLSGNGTTGTYDLILLLTNYGTYCPESNPNDQ